MALDPMMSGASIVWGFLVGFVAWLGCFKAPERIVDWLLQDTKTSNNVKGLARVIVMLLLLYATMNALAFVPLCLSIWNLERTTDGDLFWRRSFGLAFWSSIGGVLTLFLLRRLAK